MGYPDLSVECRRKLNKGPRLTKEDTTTTPVTTRLNSPEGLGKASDDEPKGRRKLNIRRVTICKYKGYFVAEVI